MTRLVLRGPVPSKKNERSLGYRKGKLNVYIDKEQRAALDALVWQAKGQWMGREKLRHPDLSFRFHVTNDAQDKDNLQTTILDVLVKAGVLVNDNIKHCNGRLTIEHAVICERDPITFVDIEESCWKE